MKICKITVILILITVTATALPLFAAKTIDLSESMKQSLVYLDISNSQYDLSQPWKQMPVSKESGYGCAVGPYEILTTAENVMNASVIQARLYDQNAYVSATVKMVDYEYNLCLLDLNTDELKHPLKPLKFTESFPQNESLQTYWLSSAGHLTTARSSLDRAQVVSSDVSFVKNLAFLATNTSRPFGDGEVCCYGKKVIGMANWGSDSDSGIIPSETINRFLSHVNKESYAGFAAPGFEIYSLLDPTMRKYLKLPDEVENGAYVSTVYTLGTGSTELKPADVILSIDGHDLDPYGRYLHPKYDRISFEHLILQAPAGKMIPFKIYREGNIISLDVEAKSIKSDNMLIPYYSYGKQPEYAVFGGYVFQKLTRDYFSIFGSDWSGKAPPHLYHYYRNLSFKPSSERKDIVILSYVLPAPLNQGYQQLSQLIVKSLNGEKIKSYTQFYSILNKPDTRDAFEVEFEMDSPAVIIPKEQLQMVNMQIAQIYGIPKLANNNE